ncbi:hypothetical protein R1flu_008581 [Riccia fluitans]|uniref:Uncharacterized protein n=1 Tax=Riccia fluitans TaxID=41844 RepID=A0ABD1YC26_9MARC
MEQLCCIALFDGEAELTPNLRPAWMKIMENQTTFVHYPSPKPNELSSLEFWTLDHCGILPYYMRMQANAIPSTVFFSMIGNSAIAKREEERTERLVLRGIDGNDFMNVDWANMLAGGLALAVKEYIRKFDRGQDPGLVEVDWALALVQIVREGRTELSGALGRIGQVHQ